MADTEDDPVAIHVMVVGFHHKRGMQVEYAYPKLGGEDGCDLPDLWKHLPSLCLPDGAHNHEADVVFFHLPHLTKPDQTVFGVSCYRQIDAEKVSNKSADITRNTVQKSVCVLSSLPIYGYIQERLQVTTKVYFKGADFSDVQDLKGLYHDLNTTNWRDKLAHGVYVSDAVRVFGRNILVLFKLILLEKRVLFFHSPVCPLVHTITSLLALLPDNFPDGFAHAASLSNECEEKQEQVAEDEGDHGSNGDTDNSHNTLVDQARDETGPGLDKGHKIDNSEPGKIINVTEESLPSDLPPLGEESERRSSNSSLTSVTSRGSIMSPPEFNGASTASATAANTTNLTSRMVTLKGRLSGAFNYWTGREKSPTQEKPSSTATPNPSPSEPGDDIPESPTTGMALAPTHDTQGMLEGHEGALDISDTQDIPPGLLSPCQSHPEKFAALTASECGLPLQIFTKGNLLHPYLSLQYLDVLNAPTCRAFTVGASNALFVHKKSLYDVVIQLDEGKIEIPDPELKKQLSLSMEDLRFAENVVRQVEAVSATVNNKTNDSSYVMNQHPDVFMEGVGWVGGEEWLRYQFKVYLLSLLRSSVCPEGTREHEVFNSTFMATWKNTENYKLWINGGPYLSLMELNPGHPHAGNLSMTDMRIRLSHTIQGLDKNKRINQTLATTGTAVVKTKEAVGGALTSASGAIKNLWSSFTTPAPNADPSQDSSQSATDTAIEATESLQQAQEGGPETAIEAQEIAQNASNEKAQIATEIAAE